jgi:thiol-disulfide isomerase/thioredoxin
MKKIIIIIVFGLIFTSCKKKSETEQSVTISGTILNHNDELLILSDFYGKSQWEQNIEVRDSGFVINLDINQPTTKSLAYGDNLSKNIFLMPSKKISVSFDANDYQNSFKFNGDLAIENSILDSVSVLDNVNYKFLYSETLDIVVRYLDSIENKSNKLLQKLTSENPTAKIFKEYTNTSIVYEIAYLKLFLAESKSECPENYYDFLNKLTFTKPNLLDIPSYRFFLNSYVDRETNLRIQKLDLKQKQVPDIEFTESLKVINQFENDEIKAYSLYNAMMNKLFASGTEGFEKHFDYFKKNNSDKHYEEQLQIAFKERNRVAPGKLAPEFAVTDINGKEVSLSNLRGKFVYLDFWATTCPHSIKETDSYVQLYSDYGTSEIEFVSISADLDENRWKNYVEENKNVGSILRVESSWGQKLFRDYQINTSPAYVLIDREGKIIDPVAPRPSSKNIRETFDKLLSNN